MRGVIIHAPKDLRIEEVATAPLGPHDVRVRIEAGGICGSDLHYYHHGGFGTVRLQAADGARARDRRHDRGGRQRGVRVSPGTRVAVNPSQPCGACRYCRAGRHNQCLDMRFMGSAMRFPHVQGGFRQSLVVDESQAVQIPPTMTMAEAAMAEPLAVCLHAALQAGSLLGAKVLVTGCGPIGALAVVAARHGGAAEIVATDVSDLSPVAGSARRGVARRSTSPTTRKGWRRTLGTREPSTFCSRRRATRLPSAALSMSCAPVASSSSSASAAT